MISFPVLLATIKGAILSMEKGVSFMWQTYLAFIKYTSELVKANEHQDAKQFRICVSLKEAKNPYKVPYA